MMVGVETVQGRTVLVNVKYCMWCCTVARFGRRSSIDYEQRNTHPSVGLCVSSGDREQGDGGVARRYRYRSTTGENEFKSE